MEVKNRSKMMGIGRLVQGREEKGTVQLFRHTHTEETGADER